MEITKEMIINPSKITQAVKDNIKSWAKGCKFAVISLENRYDAGTRFVEKHGIPVCEEYNNGKIQYECVDAYQTKEEAFQNAELKRKCTNKKFTNVSVIEL